MKLQVDWKAFGHELGDSLMPHLKSLGTDGAEVVARVKGYEGRVSATMQALEHETDPETAAELKTSLEKVLPAEEAAIRSLAATKLASNAQAAFESALAVATKIALVIVRSYVPIPNLPNLSA